MLCVWERRRLTSGCRRRRITPCCFCWISDPARLTQGISPSTMRRRALIIVFSVLAIAVAVMIGWLTSPPPTSNIKIASAFAPTDVKKIRHAISHKNLQGLGAAVTGLNYRRFSTSLRLLCFSRIDSISGYPGPPGGARVEGHVGRYNTCAYMVFNSTNGWTCQSADLISPPPPPVSNRKGYGKS